MKDEHHTCGQCGVTMRGFVLECVSPTCPSRDPSEDPEAGDNEIPQSWSTVLIISDDDAVAVKLALIEKADRYRREAGRYRKESSEKAYCLAKQDALLDLAAKLKA